MVKRIFKRKNNRKRNYNYLAGSKKIRKPIYNSSYGSK